MALAFPTANLAPAGSGTIDPHLVRVFDGLHVAGATGFAFILLSALLSRANRHFTWFNFCIAWIIYSMSSCMLFVAGQTFNPSSTLCVTQAAIAYAAPPIMAWTTLSLVIYLLLTIRGLNPAPHFSMGSVADNPACFLVAGIQNPQNVRLSPGGTYCIMDNSVLPEITTFVTAGALIAFICVEGVIVYLLIKSRRDITTGFSQATALSIRVFIFTIVGIALVVVTFVYTFSPGHSLINLDIFLAAIPPCGVVVFGSQIDLFRVWMFWKNQPSAMGTRPK
ncbi:hypothetical protein BD779DRAFT_1673076 [Infundibulicybe gibba]|nr:hypothetical protein BD779DRAFT_1673076 [Infundibulicybe gibba]